MQQAIDVGSPRGQVAGVTALPVGHARELDARAARGEGLRMRDERREPARHPVGLGERRRIGVGDRVGVHARVHLARVDRDDPHARALELGGQDAPEVIVRRLRDAVRAPARVGRDRGVRAHVHDEPAAAQRHRAGDDLREAERPDEVHGEHALEILAVGVEQQRQRHGPERARVVDEDVDGPDERGRGARDAVRVPLVADVAGERVGLAARGADLACDRLERLVAARHEREPRARAPELPRERGAEPPARARDEHGGVLERPVFVFHRLLLSSPSGG